MTTNPHKKGEGAMKNVKRWAVVLLALVVAVFSHGCSSGGSNPVSPDTPQYHWIYFSPPTGGVWTYQVNSAILGTKIVSVQIDGVDTEIDQASVVRVGFYENDRSWRTSTYRGEPAYLAMTMDDTEATGIWGYELADGRKALMKTDRIAIVGKRYEVVSGGYIHYYD